MSMGGKRFGAGIVGGLLLGLLIVGGSGFATGLYGSFTAAGVQNVAEVSSTYQTNSSIVSSSSTLSYTLSSTTGPSSPNSSSYGSATSTVVKSESSSVATGEQINQTVLSQSTSRQTPSSNPGPWFGFGFNAAYVATNGGSIQAAPSRLNAIAAQPAVLNGLVLLPLLIAIFLGAILYRASTGKNGTSDAEPEDD